MKIPFPKQHGAWGMLYVPYLTVIFAYGAFNINAALAFLLLTIAFALQEPILALSRLSAVRQKNRERYLFALEWAIVYASLLFFLTLLLSILLVRPYLFIFGVFAALVIGVHLYQQKQRTDRKLSGEVLSVLGLTASAPATWYILTGRFDSFAVVLWMLNLVYFTSSIFYVKLRVSRTAKKNGNQIAQQCAWYHAFLLLFLVIAFWMQRFSFFILLAFLPVLIRSFWELMKPAERLNLRRIGFAEIGFSLIFLMLLSYGLHVS
jgi:YwiC-like protein